MATRRNFLKLVGGGAIAAAGGAAVWASTRDPAAAREPWRQAGMPGTDPRRHALSYAILAPNPHNRQPWIADLSRPDEITLLCDPDRRLPETDPFDRQITIGLGCFLELLAQAAAQQGNRAEIALFPEGEPQPRLDGRPVATIRFARDAAVPKDPLFAQVLARRSNKEAYDLARPVPEAAIATIMAAQTALRADYTAEPDRVAELRAKAWEAMLLEMSTYRTAKESVDLIRIGRAEIEASPDGIDLSGAFLEGLSMAGLLARQDMLDPTSNAFKQQIPILKEPFDTAMAFLWLTTPGNRRVDQIAAGRAYLRINLAATGIGVSMQPFSQALQEFPEMKPHYDTMRSALEVGADETLQMLVRLGYGPTIAGAPRWPYETRIRNA